MGFKYALPVSPEVHPQVLGGHSIVTASEAAKRMLSILEEEEAGLLKCLEA